MLDLLELHPEPERRLLQPRPEDLFAEVMRLLVAQRHQLVGLALLICPDEGVQTPAFLYPGLKEVDWVEDLRVRLRLRSEHLEGGEGLWRDGSCHAAVLVDRVACLVQATTNVVVRAPWNRVQRVLLRFLGAWRLLARVERRAALGAVYRVLLQSALFLRRLERLLALLLDKLVVLVGETDVEEAVDDVSDGCHLANAKLVWHIITLQHQL